MRASTYLLRASSSTPNPTHSCASSHSCGLLPMVTKRTVAHMQRCGGTPRALTSLSGGSGICFTLCGLSSSPSAGITLVSCRRCGLAFDKVQPKSFLIQAPNLEQKGRDPNAFSEIIFWLYIPRAETSQMWPLI